MSFKGFCAKGHDRIDFEDGRAFEEHMLLEHGKRKPRPGGASHHTNGKAAPMGNGKPYPWKAPKANPKALEAWVRSGDLAIGEIAKGDWQGHGYLAASA